MNPMYTSNTVTASIPVSYITFSGSTNTFTVLNTAPPGPVTITVVVAGSSCPVFTFTIINTPPLFAPVLAA